MPGELLYLRQGLYHRHLIRFLARFARDRLFVLLYDDLALAPDATVRQVLRVLGVDDQAPIDISIRYNPTGTPLECGDRAAHRQDAAHADPEAFPAIGHPRAAVQMGHAAP